MKIILHRVVIRDGDQGAVMAGINKPLLMAEIAETCRKCWDLEWADLEEECPGPLPADSTEAINAYFDSVRWEDEDEFDEDAECSCDWENIDIDLAPPADVELDLSIVSPNSFSVERTAFGGARCKGKLFPDSGEAGDAIESFVLALTAAGFPVWHPAFKEALQTTESALANNLAD